MTPEELDALPIGSRVIIKDYKDMEAATDSDAADREYGFYVKSLSSPFWIDRDMYKYCGQIAKVIRHYGKDNVILKLPTTEDGDTDNLMEWQWCASMLDLPYYPTISQNAFKEIMK